MEPTERADDTGPTRLHPDLDENSQTCPRCQTRYDRQAIKPPEFRCSCNLELAYPDLSPNGEVRGVFGWLASPGTIIHERYRVVQLLGRGGFGSTYLVEDLKLSNKRWALKEIPQTMYDEHEDRILSKLNHPSIPTITDREIVDGMVYMVLEFGGSRTFKSVRRSTKDGWVELGTLAAWVRQLCDVLAYMHAQTPPVVHRDLKPGNVLLDDQDRVMLIDFGIAKEAIESEQTRTLGRAVTHGFSPPEQAMGSGTDARSDIYALAATTYYMLTGQRPAGARDRIQGAEVTLPSTIVPGIPPAIDRGLLQALALNPNERQQSVEEFGSCFDYDAPTVKTYEDVGIQDRTVMVGSADTARSEPTTTGTQRSLKIGPDGTTSIVEQDNDQATNNKRVITYAAVALLMIAVGVGAYWFVKQESTDDTPVAESASSEESAASPDPQIAGSAELPAAPTPVVAVAAPVPAASAPISPAPIALAPAAVAPVPAQAPAAGGTSAMDELMKRRQVNIDPAPAPMPAPPVKRKPKPKVKKAVVAKSPPPPPPKASTGSTNAAKWQNANTNTTFQELNQ